MASRTASNAIEKENSLNIVLQQFDGNFAHFLLFMHFVLSCLHRRARMPQRRTEVLNVHLPFCKDRAQQPAAPRKPGNQAQQVKGTAEEQPAQIALKRLETLRDYLKNRVFDGFISSPGRITKRNPAADLPAPSQNDNLKDQSRRPSAGNRDKTAQGRKPSGDKKKLPAAAAEPKSATKHSFDAQERAIKKNKGAGTLERAKKRKRRPNGGV